MNLDAPLPTTRHAEFLMPSPPVAPHTARGVSANILGIPRVAFVRRLHRPDVLPRRARTMTKERAAVAGI